MKRILCFVDSLVAGGAQRQLVGLAVLLQQKGYVVKVITYHNIPFYLPYLNENKVDCENLLCGKGLFQRLRKIHKAIKEFSPDVVISYLNSPNILACILKAFGPKWKLIVSDRNTTQNLNSREKLKFFLYKYADFIISNSYSQADYISVNYPLLKDKCYVITNFVDTDTFCPTEAKKQEGQIRIIGVGRIAPQKNIPILIDALKVVQEKGSDIRVDWYGNEFESFEECVRHIRQNGLQNCFEFHKPYNPIVEKYHESDIFILPSLYEGFPNVLCEAMSCGLISIASNVCDNGRIIKDGVNGFLFPSGDANKLADCIRKVITLSATERNRMSEVCRNYAIEMFSPKVFIDKYIKIINQ